MNSKRGLSPVIATVLLIVLAVVISLIVYVWAKNFIGESIQKDLGSGPEAIENICASSELGFVAEYAGGSMDFLNIGNVPIYGFEIKKKGFGSLESVDKVTGLNIISGESRTSSISSGGISTGDVLIVTPILLGEGEDNKVAYPCSDEFGIELTA